MLLVVLVGAGDATENGQGKNSQKRAFLGLPGFCPDSAQESFSTTAENGTFLNENGSQPTPENDVFYSGHCG